MSNFNFTDNFTTTDSSTPQSSMLVYFAYIGVGSVAILANFLLISVYLSNKTLFMRFILFVGLALADLINGCAFVWTGFYRIFTSIAIQNDGINNTSTYICASTPHNALWVIGGQWAATITLILGIERFVAVRFPIKYYKFTMHYGWILLASFVFVLISFGNALIRGMIVEKDTVSSRLCSIRSAYGDSYAKFGYLFISIAYLSGFILNIAAYLMVKSRFSKNISNDQLFKKELKKIRLIFIVTFFSVLFLGLPNVYLYLSDLKLFSMGAMLGSWLNIAFVCRSSLNIFLIGVGNKEFMLRVKSIINTYFKKGLFIITASSHASVHLAKVIMIRPSR